MGGGLVRDSGPYGSGCLHEIPLSVLSTKTGKGTMCEEFLKLGWNTQIWDDVQWMGRPIQLMVQRREGVPLGNSNA